MLKLRSPVKDVEGGEPMCGKTSAFFNVRTAGKLECSVRHRYAHVENDALVFFLSVFVLLILLGRQ